MASQSESVLFFHFAFILPHCEVRSLFLLKALKHSSQNGARLVMQEHSLEEGNHESLNEVVLLGSHSPLVDDALLLEFFLVRDLSE